MMTYTCFTFHVVQCVPQHFEHTHIERVTEGFVIEVDSRISLHDKQKQKNKHFTRSLNLKFDTWNGRVFTSLSSVMAASRVFKKESETKFFTCKSTTRTRRRSDCVYRMEVGTNQTIQDVLWVSAPCQGAVGADRQAPPPHSHQLPWKEEKQRNWSW